MNILFFCGLRGVFTANHRAPEASPGFFAPEIFRKKFRNIHQNLGKSWKNRVFFFLGLHVSFEGGLHYK